MPSRMYVYFGNDIFKIFPHRESKLEQTILKESQYLKCFTVEDLQENCDLLSIDLGWSFGLFNLGGKFYHTGFPKVGGVMQEVFKGFKEKELLISCGENQVLACTRDGKIFFYSTQDLKHAEFDLSHQSWNIEDLISGETQSIALMKDGSVFKVQLMGKLSACLDPIPMSCHVTKVSCGKEHTLFLSEQGQVYSFGSGSRGQLGHGSIENVSSPTLLEPLDGIRIKSVQCGGWHSTALSWDGDLYTWGWNENGQLGFPCAKLCLERKLPIEVETVCCLPKVVEFGLEIVIKTVSCGTQHTAVMTEDNEIWTWGWNGYGQLGRGTQPHSLSDKPCKINFLPSFKPATLKCAFWSTLISGSVSDKDPMGLKEQL